MTGVELIAHERARQIQEEGWTPEHDDEHDGDELAWAAVCYAAPESVFIRHDFAAGTSYRDPWPWDAGYDKRPHNGNVLQPMPEGAERVRLLVKAGALIAAEIDRLTRARRAAPSGHGGKP